MNQPIYLLFWGHTICVLGVTALNKNTNHDENEKFFGKLFLLNYVDKVNKLLYGFHAYYIKIQTSIEGSHRENGKVHRSR